LINWSLTPTLEIFQLYLSVTDVQILLDQKLTIMTVKYFITKKKDFYQSKDI
jgi:hypothetical protein